ncbi:MAG: helix-turn-helix transcriptional regulator [Candidatus Cybelea sp.]
METKTAIGKEVIVDPTDADEDLTAEMLSATEVLIYENVTKRLDALRAKIRAAGIKSVARDSGVSRSQLQAIVNGGKTPHKATIARLEATLKATGTERPRAERFRPPIR